MACIDNLVVSGICDDTVSETGFTLMQAPGMNVKNFADIASDSSGVEMVEETKALTLLQVKNDFIGALQMNRVVTQMANPVYNTSNFKVWTSVGTGNSRGLTIHKVQVKGGLRKTKIHKIEAFPLTSGDGVIQIIDNNQIYSWNVTFVGGQINIFTATQLDDLPYTIIGKSAQVLITGTTVEFASSEIICHTGCSGMPNDCAHAIGWDGTKDVKKEGYGLNVYFGCECDYEQIICDAKAMFGEIIFLKWQINIFKEQYMSNRFDNWVIYGREDLEKYIPQLENQYITKWNQMMDGIFGILNTYRDSCLNCRGVRWVTNV